jgi:hypothetical protein
MIMSDTEVAAGIGPQSGAQEADRLDDTAIRHFYSSEPPSKNDLNIAIDAMSQSVALTPEENPRLAERVLDLAEMLRRRYLLSRKHEDLIQAVATIERATALVPSTHQYFPNYISTYVKIRDCQFLKTQDESIIDDTISKLRGDPSGLMKKDASLLQFHGVFLFRRYERRGDLNDLKYAIQASEQIVSSQALGELRVFALSNLAQLYGHLYKRDGQEKHLNWAVKRGQQALQESTSTPSDKALLFGALSKALMNRFEHNGKQEDIDEAILQGESAAQQAAENDPDRAEWMNNLGLCYEQRFERTGDINDLKRAIQSTEKSLELTPKDDTGLPRRTNNLANQLGRRFEQTGESEYLNQAIQKLEVVADSEKLSPSDRSVCLSNLSFLLIQRFERTRDPEYLDESIEKSRKSIEGTPPGQKDLPSRRNILGNALRLRYEQKNQEKDLEEAIRSGEEARSFSNENDPYRGTWLSNLGLSYLLRFKKNKASEDLEEATKLTEESMKCRNHLPDRAARLINLGNMLMLRCTLPKPPEHTEITALQYYKEAAEIPNGIPLQRIKAARSAIRILQKRREWDQMRVLGENAMQLLPGVCGRYLIRQDQQQALLETSGLAADVCSILLKKCEVEKALRQLEFGKAVLIGYTIDNHDDLTALKADQPDLAKRYGDLRSKLYLQPSMQMSSIAEAKMRERRTAAYDMEECLSQIRKIKGHENFLRELSLDEMRACAKEGPIVVVNVTDISSDAILVSTAEVRAIPLPEVYSSAVPDFVFHGPKGFGSSDKDFLLDRDIQSETESDSMNKDAAFSWLWRVCVKVVLKELKAANMLDQQSGLARVWWIGAGVASSFPFHAAASSFDNYESKEDTLSKMVPSYTPSIKALSHSRENSRKYAQIEHKERKLTIVTMPKTPGQARLPGVENESNSISKICDGFYACTELWEPTASAVLKSIVKSEIVHFACHGMSHVGDPSKSHLLLQKAGDSGPVVDELTVSKLLSVEDASLAWIAYVSACSTAQISASKLADEGIHISSALQIAGFAHVIGSLWRVDDGVCVKVASKFYKALIESQSQQLCNRAVAEALRSAVLNVRAQNLELWKWGAYIHSGA